VIGNFCFSQKYALLDKQMAQPVTFANTITMQQSFAGFIAVEKEKLSDFVTALDNIAKQLHNAKKVKPEAFKLTVANTTFTAIKIGLKEEDRLDVVLVSNVGAVKSSMHLCDAKISNENNAFFVNTWAKYIRGYMATVGLR
jgi:hypothetical protein